MIKNVSKFCGANMKKIKNVFSMMKVQAHNLRDEREVELGENIDKDKIFLNRITAFNNFDGIMKTYYKCLKKCKKKPRKDHIKCLDYVFYRSDCFDNQSENDLFRECALEFFKSYFGDCPYIVYEHNDEKTQHFHVMVIPFSEKEEKFIGSNFCGKRQNLIELQTLFAEYCMACGLERGKEETKNRNKSLKKYYEEEAQRIEQECQKKNEELQIKSDELQVKLDEVNNANNSLDEEIALMRNVADAETVEKYEKGLLEYVNTLNETLKHDDGSDFYYAIRQCLDYLKQILIDFGVFDRNKNKDKNNER